MSDLAQRTTPEGTPATPVMRVERIALGGSSQGGLYEARRAMAAVDAWQARCA